MTNKEAINILKIKRECMDYEGFSCSMDLKTKIDGVTGCFICENAIDMAIKALEKTTWIPCSERLPDRNGTYLVTICSYDETANINYMSVEHGNSNGSFLHYGTEKPLTKSGKYIVAWMPLPEPYKEVEHET